MKGFRDIYRKLTDHYGLQAKIPTCNQLIENNDAEKVKIKQLTTKQTTENRLVTKVNIEL